MPAKQFPHVQLRGGIYQYVRRVPQRVLSRTEAYKELFGGRPTYRVSLKTKIYLEALAAAAVQERHFDALVAKALDEHTPNIACSPKSELNAAALGNVSAQIRNDSVIYWRSLILRANIDDMAREFLDVRLDQFVDDRDNANIETAVLSGRSPVQYAREVNSKLGFFVAEDSNEFAELVAAIIDGCHEARKAVNELFEGHSLPLEPSSSLIRNFAAKTTPKHPSKSFSEVIAIQFSTKNFAAKTKAKMHRSQTLFIEIAGDKDINEYTKDDVRKFLDRLAEQQVGKATGQSRPISRTTMQSYVSGISSPFDFAINRGWRTEDNPASGIRIENWRDAPNGILQPKRRRFEIEELRALFRHPWFSGCYSDSKCYEPGEVLLNDMRYWAPIVALYTGMRAGEIGGLKLDEIRLEDHAPHILVKCNEYRNTKSKLDRHVPVLDALMNLGFADYVAKVRESNSDRLFPDWDLPLQDAANSAYFNWANCKWIRAFNRTVIPSVFPTMASSGGRSPVVFHSFRGAFKFMLMRHGPSHLANAILGHSQDDLDKAYIGSVAPGDTYAAFKSADYDSLAIPSRSQDQ